MAKIILLLEFLSIGTEISSHKGKTQEFKKKKVLKKTLFSQHVICTLKLLSWKDWL